MNERPAFGAVCRVLVILGWFGAAVLLGLYAAWVLVAVLVIPDLAALISLAA